MNQMLWNSYASLLIRSGLNVRSGQLVMISSSVDCAEFTRLLVREAYDAGASDVSVDWHDDLIGKMRYSSASEEVFESFPDWKRDYYMDFAKKGAAFLSLDAPIPELLRDLDPARVAKAAKVRSQALREFSERKMRDWNAWCIAAYPTPEWARKVFPHLSEEESVEALWNAIFSAARIGDSSETWDGHLKDLQTRCDTLNAHAFSSLHFRNASGTDLTIALPERHLWLGGSSATPEDTVFSPNIPTEEVFTSPLRSGVNGTLAGSRPLSYRGSVIDRFSLTFENGRITAYHAEVGHELLKQIIETDDGSHYLGEIALVPYHSPISESGVLFYNTLFDENASCHLAIGAAYPCIRGIREEDNLSDFGLNKSLVHVDLMFGTADLSVDGIDANGRVTPIFRSGNYAL